jgi:hypothetical protein
MVPQGKSIGDMITEAPIIEPANTDVSIVKNPEPESV